MQKIVQIALFCLWLPAMLWGQMATKPSFSGIEEAFLTQLAIFPQEKIHVHTDRNYYVPGEKIWFRAYVTDAVTHQSPTLSRFVFAELIDARDSLVSRVMIRPENEQFYGHIFLSEIIPEGNYTFRAYTRYMENMGDDYFFKKNIRIGNIKGGNRGNGESSGILALAQHDFEVSFFPEGGNVVEGAICKVAFKALNRNGYPENITGILIDDAGAELNSIQTWYAGMGLITYIPESGKKYYLKCRNVNGLEKQFELPQPTPQASSLAISFMSKRHVIKVQKSMHAPDIPYYILAHCQGIMLYFSAWDKEKAYITFSEKELPAGIIHFILFDEAMNPLSERLVFNKNYDDAKLDFYTDKTVYEKREKVIASMSLTSSHSAKGQGVGCSVSITDDADISVDSSTTIQSSLLLSSELRGYINNPAYYLQDNPVSVIALDLLMMTHGWRRYNIPEVVKGNPEYPTIPFQLSQKITGKVKSLTSSKVIPDSDISILTKAGDFGLTSTDENGLFMIQDFEYPDSTFFFFQALSRRGSKYVELVIDKESYPKPVHAPFVETDYYPSMNETDYIPSLHTDAFITKAEQRSKFDEAMWVIHLSAVEVSASRIERKIEPRLQFWANASSDVTIRREQIERRNPQLVTEMLNGVAGIRVSRNGIPTIREGGNLHGSYLPLVLIDGIPIEWPKDWRSIYDSPLEAVNVENVESIDVFKGSSAAVFGVSGAGGVISITTKKGGVVNNPESNEYNYITYTPLGYLKPAEFYSPNYETLESKQKTIPDYRTTIFWKPDIVISETGEATFDFYASDFPTTYSVVIEGLTSDGRIVRQVEKIRVE